VFAPEASGFEFSLKTDLKNKKKKNKNKKKPGCVCECVCVCVSVCYSSAKRQAQVALGLNGQPVYPYCLSSSRLMRDPVSKSKVKMVPEE